MLILTIDLLVHYTYRCLGIILVIQTVINALEEKLFYTCLYGRAGDVIAMVLASMLNRL
jgi:hypothetical protein